MKSITQEESLCPVEMGPRKIDNSTNIEMLVVVCHEPLSRRGKRPGGKGSKRME